MSWSGGYVTDLEYTYGFYRELAPSLQSLALLWSRAGAPSPSGKLAYCELGCGHGMSANILAAANPGIEFFATDFNPGQVAFARELAASTQLANMHFFEDSFAEFAERKDLPEFDIISLHGIYSWIKAEYRENICEIIRRRLKPGGIVYISYNCLPGWAAAAPMRHLLYLHGKTSGGPTGTRVGPALDFAAKVEASGSRYFQSVPGLKQRLEKLHGQNRNYVAHEYMNDAWQLLYFSDVAAELSEAKLGFAASAALLDAIDVINLTKEQKALLGGIADPVLRETTRDYIINQQFRRDLFVKGRVPARSDVFETELVDLPFVLTVPLDDLNLTIKGALGGANASEGVYRPIAEIIAEGPRSARQIVTDARGSKIKLQEIMQALYILTGAEQAHPCLPPEGADARRASTDRFNQVILERAPHFSELRYMASPVTGSGHPVDRMAQLFLAGRAPNTDPKHFAEQALARRGERLVVDGKPVTDSAVHEAEMAKRVRAFEAKQLPLLKRLGIA
ncbi:MAG: class I SAM-dependent methyltransferase [Rhizobiaceae bacterium]|nr:class I SAM-dependent methyltransferase [Rhizobiaceae bacterium]